MTIGEDGPVDVGRTHGILYRFEFDRRYRPAISPQPYVARLDAADAGLVERRIELPRIGVGQVSVRIKGSYDVHDGEVLVIVERGYAEVFIVHRGYRLPLWWGVPEDFKGQESWLNAFLDNRRSLPQPGIDSVKRHLKSLREYDSARPGEITAISEFLNSMT